MNLSLVTSFVIAGVLMLSIVSLNTRVAESSAELTLRYILEERGQTIERMITYDFPKIGNNVYARIESPITDARKNLIEFKSNLDNSGSVETVTWKYTSNSSDGSGNPNDKVLYREVDGDRISYSSGVTNLEFTYLNSQLDTLSYSNLTAAGDEDADDGESDDGEDDGDGNQSIRNNIRYIVVNLTIQTQELIGGSGASKASYLETNWKKKFSVFNQIN